MYQCMHIKSLQSCPTLHDPHGLQSTRLLCPWDSPGKNTGVGCRFLLQEIFPTQGLNPSIPHYRRRQWHPTPVLLPGKSHGQRSLVDCSPWGHTESDTTEWLHFHFSLSCTGEGNGNPLHCSCLENPRDRGAWWAAVHGVTQSRTWLKWLSCSSNLKCIVITSSGTGSYTTCTTDFSIICWVTNNCRQLYIYQSCSTWV